MQFLKYFKTQLFLQEIFWFSLAQFLGVFLARRAGALIEEIQAPSERITLADFFIYFLAGTIIIFILSRRSKVSDFIMRLLFIFTLFFGVDLFLSFFINPVSAFYFSAACVVARFVLPSIFLHNIIFLFSVTAFSSVLALQFNAMTIVVLLAALAVYDIISVYITKHMVKMAKAMIESKLIFGLIIPEKIKYNFWAVEKAKPGEGVVFLGGGDVGLPLFLVANTAFSGLAQGFVVALFAILGMMLSYWLFVSQKFRKPMPALPPISMMAIMGYVLIKIIWG